MNKKIILVSHGKLAEGMAYSAQMICGENEDLEYFGMMPGEHYSTIVETIRNKAEENKDTQYIVIADLFGGSVCNGCVELVNVPNIKLISGMNLPLVIALLFEEAPFSDQMIEGQLNDCKQVIKQVKPEEVNCNNSDDDFF